MKVRLSTSEFLNHLKTYQNEVNADAKARLARLAVHDGNPSDSDIRLLDANLQTQKALSQISASIHGETDAGRIADILLQNLCRLAEWGDDRLASTTATLISHLVNFEK